jgi:hypothetical protein
VNDSPEIRESGSYRQATIAPVVKMIGAIVLPPLLFLVVAVLVISVAVRLSDSSDTQLPASDTSDFNAETFALLQGGGTHRNPYLIQSIDDIELFRDAVNKGFDCEGLYFAQTVDLDFSSIENWIPIGVIFSEGGFRAFRGVYDGLGHTVKNITIHEDGYGDHTGFFGMLAGTVRNFGIESGSIRGSCVGSIASHGTEAPRIVNCYNKAALFGSTRAGGIADNFETGAIISCVNLGEVESAGAIAGICSYTAESIQNCYATTPLTNSSFSGEASESARIENEDIVTVVHALNNNVWVTLPYRETILWEVDNGSLEFSEVKISTFGGILRAIKRHSVFLISFGAGVLLLSTLIQTGLIRFRNANRKIIFSTIMFVGYIIYGAIYFATNASVATNYFVQDTTDSFMDFFNPLKKDMVNTYSYPYYSNYPPLANLLAQFFRALIPSTAMDAVPELGATSLRSVMQSNIALVLFLLPVVLALAVLFFRYLKSSERPCLDKILVVVLLFSGPFIFTYERANNIILVLLLTGIFLLYYKSERRMLRECALLSLALATGLKLYPALFALLLLSEKSYREFLRVTLYGIATVFLPFVFYDGVSSAQNFIANLVSRNSDTIYPGLGGSLSFSKTMEVAFTYVLHEVPFHFSPWMYSIPLLLCIFNYISSKEEWKKVLALCLLILWIPNASHIYVLCFFIFPLILFLKEKSLDTAYDWWYLVAFVTLFSFYALPKIEWMNQIVDGRGITYGMIILHIVLWGFALTNAAENLTDLAKRRFAQNSVAQKLKGV